MTNQNLPYVFILPWCRLENVATLKQVAVTPSREIDPAFAPLITKYMRPYIENDGSPVKKYSIVSLANKKQIDKYTEEEVELLSRSVRALAFSSLASRKLGYHHHSSRDGYSNSHVFNTVYQRAGGDGSWIATVSRRADGHLLNATSPDKARITRPLHADLESPLLDLPLAQALIDDSADQPETAEAIDCFCLANTDDNSIHIRTEWTLLVSVIDRLFEDKMKSQRAQGAARAIQELFEPSLGSKDMLTLVSYRDCKYPPIQQWVKEFYDFRNEFSHGAHRPRNNRSLWSLEEHMLLARLALPLVVKKLMAVRQSYVLGDHDVFLQEMLEHIILMTFNREDGELPPIRLLHSAWRGERTRGAMKKYIEEQRGESPESENH
jgi:hypothetical protein